MGKVVSVETVTAKPQRCVMTLFTVDEFCMFWPQLEEMLDSVPHTWRRWTKNAIYDACVDGRMQLWGIGPPPTAIMVILTMVNVFPAMRVLTLFWTGGTLTEDMPGIVETVFTEYARIQKCDEAEVLGRFGWEPIMLKHGFRKEGVFLTRTIHQSKVH